MGALRHNMKECIRLANEDEVYAVVKADAYGHGAIQCSQAALDVGAAGLAVALAHEGVELREAGIPATVPILVLSEQPPKRHGISRLPFSDC